MTVEELASKHLGVDLTQPDFWQSAVDLAVADVEQFLRMTE
jgi:oligoendopeptidase F